MPKLKQSDTEIRNAIRRKHILGNQAKAGLGDEEIATKLHFIKRTFQNKLGQPDTFTMKELTKMFDVLKFSDAEIVEMFREPKTIVTQGSIENVMKEIIEVFREGKKYAQRASLNSCSCIGSDNGNYINNSHNH
jgi:hypothetical protein